MSHLHDADAWESLRLGVGRGGALSISINGGKGCVLCGGVSPGITHILASCPHLQAQREVFLASLAPTVALILRSAPPGDWPSVLLSPHLDLDHLKVSTEYCSRIMVELKAGHA